MKVFSVLHSLFRLSDIPPLNESLKTLSYSIQVISQITTFNEKLVCQPKLHLTTQVDFGLRCRAERMFSGLVDNVDSANESPSLELVSRPLLT